MKSRPHYKKDNLYIQQVKEQIWKKSVEKANLIISICVLADCFGFGEVRINRFVDRYKELSDSFQDGNENLNKINEELWERFGLKIM